MYITKRIDKQFYPLGISKHVLQTEKRQNNMSFSPDNNTQRGWLLGISVVLVSSLLPYKVDLDIVECTVTEVLLQFSNFTMFFKNAMFKWKQWRLLCSCSLLSFLDIIFNQFKSKKCDIHVIIDETSANGTHDCWTRRSRHGIPYVNIELLICFCVVVDTFIKHERLESLIV